MHRLAEILRTKLVPWSQQNAGERFIVARPKMRPAEMPYGVQLLSDPIRSRRVIVKGKRNHKNVRNILAEWPEEGLYELSKYLLVCVLGGHIEYRLGNYSIRCGPGHFIFIPPGMPHPKGKRSYVDLEKSTSCDIATFLLHPSALECWISHANAQKRVQSGNCLVSHEYVVFLLRALMREVTGEGYQNLRINEKLLNLFFEVLLLEIEAERLQSVYSADQVEQRVIAASNDFLTHLEQFVQTNLQKPLTLDTVSAEMNFSPTHFTRLMRRETGKTFNEYLAERRIREAKALLRHTDWTITAIATMVGIKSPSYFRTFFKQ